MLKQLDYLPENLLELEATQLSEVLQEPTLIHLSGEHSEPLFVSVLVHGNETVGWDAVRLLLKKFTSESGAMALPRALSIFIANVEAASQGARHLPEQPDYNRVWPGCPEQASKDFPRERAMMQQVVDIMAQRRVFASIDLHNNTGLNPHYACINVVNDHFLYLAMLFSRTIVYFINPCQVNSMAMSKICPAVTLECGKVGQKLGVQHAVDYLDACLRLTGFPAHALAEQDYDLFHTVATVHILDTVAFDFDNASAEFNLPGDIEYMNFRELPVRTRLGKCADDKGFPIDVVGEQGQLLTDKYFVLEQGQLLLKQAVMPSMLTTNKEVIRQDCLCYLMERYDSGIMAFEK